MKRLVLSVALAMSGGAIMACDVGASGIVGPNQPGWTADIVHARHQWDGGSMALPQFCGDPVRTSGTRRALKLSKYAGVKPIKRRRGGVPATLAEPIGKDLRMPLNATGVDWTHCATDALRWYDETFADGVRAVSREVPVIRR